MKELFHQTLKYNFPFQKMLVESIKLVTSLFSNIKLHLIQNQ